MRAFAYRGAELAGDGHYLPSYASVKQSPQAGKFYQVHKGDTPWKVSRDSYGSANVKKGLYALNDSPWNGFIRKASTGWEAYKIKGLQFQAKYSNKPMRSGYGSGISYPVIWIPAIGGGEPVKPKEDPTIPYFGPFIPSGPAPDVAPDKPPFVIPATPKKKKAADRPKKKRKTVPFDPVPNKKKKKKKKAAEVVPAKRKKKKKAAEVVPAKKKKKGGKKPPEIKIVEVQVPVPQPCPHKEDRKWSPWLVGGIALALGLVVADNRNGRR